MSVTEKETLMAQATVQLEMDGDGAVRIQLAGEWRLGKVLPSADAVTGKLEALGAGSRVFFDTRGVSDWDSGLLTFLLKVFNYCLPAGISISTEGLPSGAGRLLALATTVPERTGARREGVRVPFLARLGDWAFDFRQSLLDNLSFLGETLVAFLRLLAGKSCFRRSDLLHIIQECSIEALPIVSLISFLVGLILAFVGAIQLKLFGAEIYVADLVGIAMLRAMGAIMTGIIMAGRTGASYAAHLGTMQVNEEIDALRTTGISPVDYLVLPRILVLTLMMPLLTLYADLMGILGGLFVAVTALDMNLMEYYSETTSAVGLTNLWIGLFSALVFGFLVALSGCLRGMQCGRSASAVGDATRSAVVTGIVSIVVANAVITVACDALGI
jgi:phospholipid/cholesterol/gamma-HCH transport system permease protein